VELWTARAPATGHDLPANASLRAMWQVFLHFLLVLCRFSGFLKCSGLVSFGFTQIVLVLAHIHQFIRSFIHSYHILLLLLPLVLILLLVLMAFFLSLAVTLNMLPELH
jgi:hypothetical protein